MHFKIRFAVLAAYVLALVSSVVVAGSATANPISDGCSYDSSVADQATLTCSPGAGAGAHAFIRCRDIGGLLHTRVGTTLGTEGGVSRAVCADGETGPA
ncbi:hypothetical protein NDR87_16140 [Nocardia sp. CDC159]|uniref:Secreted protein n=1 Tax=Nocardia pulmonis TaxID=2951408 RepID=A0A9X2IZV8_9NOCA|nr:MULTISPECIES: hypothetical protein [Nocardia]MCM6775376.1 hypothetical protein [Nocardia pulmonis]MCM6787890.1 hypothetical protein [Nocardia sp. CDC159]